jgi:hypothetical protein
MGFEVRDKCAPEVKSPEESSRRCFCADSSLYGILHIGGIDAPAGSLGEPEMYTH